MIASYDGFTVTKQPINMVDEWSGWSLDNPTRERKLRKYLRDAKGRFASPEDAVPEGMRRVTRSADAPPEIEEMSHADYQRFNRIYHARREAEKRLERERKIAAIKGALIGAAGLGVGLYMYRRGRMAGVKASSAAAPPPPQPPPVINIINQIDDVERVARKPGTKATTGPTGPEKAQAKAAPGMAKTPKEMGWTKNSEGKWVDKDGRVVAGQDKPPAPDKPNTQSAEETKRAIQEALERRRNEIAAKAGLRRNRDGKWVYKNNRVVPDDKLRELGLLGISAKDSSKGKSKPPSKPDSSKGKSKPPSKPEPNVSSRPPITDDDVARSKRTFNRVLREIGVDNPEMSEYIDSVVSGGDKTARRALLSRMKRIYMDPDVVAMPKDERAIAIRESIEELVSDHQLQFKFGQSRGLAEAVSSVMLMSAPTPQAVHSPGWLKLKVRKRKLILSKSGKSYDHSS